MWKVLFVLFVLALIWMFSKDPPPSANPQQGVVQSAPVESSSALNDFAAWLRENTPKK